ncbi:MAG TPA: CdaR family protein [Desulfobacteraceae bacterium]|nr:CdaR family protein [Desulfobacteraceae bacterium]
MPSRPGIPTLLALSLLGLLFFSACATEPEETDLLVPVVFSSVPEGLVMVSPDEADVEIHVKGPGALIKGLGSQTLICRVDLYTELASDPAGSSHFIRPGTYSIPLMKKRIAIPRKCTITDITPNFVTISLEEKKTDTFPVKVPYQGKPAAGYTALPAETKPETVAVTGAASRLEDLEAIRTKPVDITRARENFKKELPLDIDPESGLSTPNKTVIALVAIEKKQITKTFADIPIETINTEKRIVISPDRMEITVKGPANILNNSGVREQFNGSMDLKGLGPGVYVRRAVINLPVGLILENAEPEIFTVKIEP